MFHRQPFWVCLLVIAAPLDMRAESRELPNPHPRELVVGPALYRWDFDTGTEGWGARNHCQVSAADGSLKIHSTGIDPYLAAPISLKQGGFVVRIRMRSGLSGPGQFFWSSTKSPGTAARRVATFRMEHDGQWHEYQTRMNTDSDLTALRLDPGGGEGDVEVDWISIHYGRLHPLEIVRVQQQPEGINVSVRNHSTEAIAASVNDQLLTIDGGATNFVTVAVPDPSRLSAVTARVASAGFPDIERKIWWVPQSGGDVVTSQWGGVTIKASRDGSQIRLLRNGQTVAVLGPLVQADFQLPELQLQTDRWPLRYVGQGLEVTIGAMPGGLLQVAVDADREVEGPVVRVQGGLEQGLLAGVEYLGKGESSSSRLDIETPEHLRVEPEPGDLTMPLAALVTDRVSVAMLWEDTSLQPTFAAPDFLDGACGHRMSLRGKKIHAVLRVAEGWSEGGRLEPAILWAVRRRGLPPLPPPPRSLDEQWNLCLAAYRGIVRDGENGGWFHAVVPGVRTSPARGAYFADCVSAIWRITGQVPQTPSLVYGGAHVRNSASYFVTGRAEQWLQTINRSAEAMIRAQQPDGSFRYDGKYRRGHFENTASGICARPAYQLLEHAWYTGDPRSLQAGLKTLQYMKRFRTPRGSQTWEVPLHTPDILASAQAVWACTRAYELTGDRQYLDEARRWAITGLPFVYQWADRPIMMYATTPVLGATNWVAPNWIGLPVQWCGTVYAYSLLLLAPYDDTLDWKKLAEGITICGEQMQYPAGPSTGSLPDVFDLKTQTRRPADINPGAMISLRLLLAGRLDALAVAHDGQHRVVAPYPVQIRDGQAVVQGKVGQKYQVVVDGARIMEVVSRGQDVIPLSGSR